ncbi:papain-like cysteine protease family protein [Xanthobacter autotrophicus DSM 431]|uniref:papain-like cysteine protease family protein n=1 Tax=Xanthobacter nonsaccharivorans TaxID=3119912 RepID=UPI00372784A7
MAQKPIEFELPSVNLGSGESADRILDVPYAQQPASNWCWATCTVMVAHFLLNSSIKICQLVSTHFSAQQCCDGAPTENSATANSGSAFFWAQTPCNKTIKVSQVSPLYAALGIQSQHRGRKIDFATLADQIATLGCPVEVAFSWLGGGGHVALVRGVSMKSQMVRVSDPWPDTGDVIVPFSQLETAYDRGQWFDCWTDLRKQQETPSDGTI